MTMTIQSVAAYAEDVDNVDARHERNIKLEEMLAAGKTDSMHFNEIAPNTWQKLWINEEAAAEFQAVAVAIMTKYGVPLPISYEVSAYHAVASVIEAPPVTVV
jgi:hypothetical protein